MNDDGRIEITPEGIMMTGNAKISFKKGGYIKFTKGNETVIIDQNVLDELNKKNINSIYEIDEKK